MSPQPEDESCRAVLPLLEACLDGELSPAETTGVRDHLASCAACAAELRLATAIRDGLRGLPELDAPPTVLMRAREEAERAGVLAFRPPRPAIRRPRFAALVAALAVALLGAVLLFQLLRSPRPAQPTPQEIAQATEQARYALAYIGRVSRRAGLELKDEVLPRHLVEPAARTLSRSLGETSEPDSAPRQGS